jgi:hypothetical protein
VGLAPPQTGRRRHRSVTNLSSRRWKYGLWIPVKIMDAIRKVHRYIKQHPRTPESLALAGLAAYLSDEREFPLGDLYRLDKAAFDLAIELIRDWRLDRYYAAEVATLEPAVGEVLSAAGRERAVLDSVPMPPMSLA